MQNAVVGLESSDPMPGNHEEDLCPVSESARYDGWHTELDILQTDKLK
jgi:hypothetical protein